MCKDRKQHEQGSPLPGLLAKPLGAVVLVWVSAGQDPFELEERSEPQIPAGPSIPGGVGHPFSLSCLGCPAARGGAAVTLP